MTQWQWAMGKLNAAHAAAKYSPRLSSAFSFQLTADDRRTADWLPPQLGSVHLLLQGSSAVAVACLAGSAVKSIAAVTVGTALPTLLGGGEEGGRGGRGKKNKKTRRKLRVGRRSRSSPGSSQSTGSFQTVCCGPGASGSPVVAAGQGQARLLHLHSHRHHRFATAISSGRAAQQGYGRR